MDVLSILMKQFDDIICFLSEKDKESWLVTTLLRIIHDNEEVERTKLGVLMLSKTVNYLTGEICESFILPEILSMSVGSSQEKCLSLELLAPLYSKLVSIDAKEKLIDRFISLCNDSDITVKLASLPIFPKLFEICEDSAVIQTLQPCFREFFKDQNEKIRHLAHLQLGPSIHISKAPFPHSLLELYLKLAKSVPPNKELQSHCAYYFPAVLEKIGKESWNLVGETFIHLCRNAESNSKKSCAASLHHIFRLVDTDRDDLFRVLMDFLQDKNLRLSVLKNLPETLKYLNPKERLESLEPVKSMAKEKNFRIRGFVAEILSGLTQHIGPYDSFIHIWPLCKALCLDPIGHVRSLSMPGIGSVAAFIMSEIPDFSNEIIKDLKKFGRSAKSMHRLVFASACDQLVELVEFEAAFGDDFALLCKDPVPAVRILCAKAVKKVKSVRVYWVLIRENLKTDADADVRREICADLNRCSEIPSAEQSHVVIKAPAVRNNVVDDLFEENWEFNSNERQFEFLVYDFRPSHDGWVKDR